MQDQTRDPSHVPARLIGMGKSICIGVFVYHASFSGVPMSCDGNTPGAMPLTRIGICLSARSVASICVRCSVAAFDDE